MINWKNTAENLVLVLITGILFTMLGLCGGYLIAIKSAEKMVNSQKSLIESAIEKNNTAITNNVSTDIRKLKSNKSAPVQIDLNPMMESKISTPLPQKQDDSIVAKPERKGFFSRIFKKSKSN